MVKKLVANAGDLRDVGSIPGLERSPGEGKATHSSILAWRIPKDRGAPQVGYSPQSHKESEATEATQQQQLC